MEDMLLPENILFDILTRLPVKSIIYCKRVCRKWRELVSDTYFVRLHLLRSRQCLLIHDCFDSSPETLLWVDIEDGYFELSRALILRSYSIVFQIPEFSSVNGLICCNCANGLVCLFNPVLEECMILPSSPSNLIALFYGFGVSTAGEYKVIRICVRRLSKTPSEINDFDIEVEIYTIGTNYWIIVRQKPFNVNLTTKMLRRLTLNGPYRGVYLNSHLYWLLGSQIYTFDLTMETLELFPISPLVTRGKSGRMLGVLKGSLSCISWCCLGLEVWVMKGESWYKEISIQENVKVNLKSRNWKPMCLTDGNILMVYNKKARKLVAYHLDTNSVGPKV